MFILQTAKAEADNSKVLLSQLIKDKVAVQQEMNEMTNVIAKKTEVSLQNAYYL
jgi:hypothetical protein